ncbi:glycosyltransferase [Opitutaceae bacterium]|nr:glycosyltransferase [Opitutaceae bacterium]
MKIIHNITRISARDGGPALSVPSLANAQKQTGHGVVIATADTEGSFPEPNANIAEIHRFERDPPTLLGRSSQLADWLAKTEADVIHHHALWHRTLHYAHGKAQRDNIRLIISPRGMMMPWAMKHHQLRKEFARRFIHPHAFDRVNGWHATSNFEADAIRAQGFNQPICVAPNGVRIPTAEQDNIAIDHWVKREPLINSRRVALFYSRFHSKKRIIECIDTWSEQAAPDWILLMIGIPDQFGVDELRAYVLKSGAQGRVRIFDGTHRPPPYAVADLFLLPSHSENFGMVVAEALANRVPAIVTEGSPWEQLSSQHCGWFVPWSKYGETLAHALKRSPQEFKTMGENGRSLMISEFGWEKSAQSLLNFYATVRIS